MSEHAGLPDPFYDAGGFPLCLELVRDEIEARGGKITGHDMLWQVTHPSPDLT